MADLGFKDESQYRAVMKETFDRVEKAFDDVDPDQAECSNQFGALTVVFADKSRLILSAQPSVRQLWMALAGKGIAHHFDFDHASRQWRDDKGGSVELFEFLRRFLSEQTGVEFKL